MKGDGQLMQWEAEVHAVQLGMEALQLTQADPSKYVASGHCARQRVVKYEDDRSEYERPVIC